MINEWVTKQNTLTFPSILKTSWERFHNDFYDSETEYTTDPFEYFKEDFFVFKYGKRKFVETLPATF